MNEETRERGIAPQGSEWILLASLFVVFAPGIVALSDIWSRYDYYSHGYMVPVAAFWAATSQRRILPKLARSPERRGALLLAGCVVLYLVGVLANIVSLQGLAIVLAVASALYLARGAAWVRSLGFSIFYLIFMVPLPFSWLNPLIAQLQVFVSTVVIEILHAMSWQVERNGNVMTLPGGESLFVAEACSGITSIVTLFPLAVFLAYFTERTLVRRLILIAAVIPLAMFGNLLRVLMTIAAAIEFGVEFATGDAIHTWAGIGTYVLGCLALLGLGSLMSHFFPVQKHVAAP